MRTMTTFRSEESAKQTCQGLSVIYTANEKGENIYVKLVEIFDRPSPPPAVPDAETPATTSDTSVEAATSEPETLQTSVPDDIPAA